MEDLKASQKAELKELQGIFNCLIFGFFHRNECALSSESIILSEIKNLKVFPGLCIDGL